MITFHYHPVVTPTGIINRPYAQIHLIHGNRHCNRIMLIDSGADISLISKETGFQLGLTASQTDRIKSLGGAGGGQIPVIYRQIEMQIGGHSFQVEVGWLQNDMPLLILGRRDVFPNFSIEFREFENLVIFRHISDLND
jgi:hypothetical protein